ncbi:MAG: hypothetical protein ABIJ56_04390 [Pseudomonadota bacterium]
MDDQNWEDRECCPDDLCTGIMGEGGRCGICGRMREGPPPVKKASSESEPFGGFSREEREEEDAEDEDVSADPDDPAEEGAAFDPDERVPCADGLCTGIIGENGRCGMCGRKPGDVEED